MQLYLERTSKWGLSLNLCKMLETISVRDATIPGGSQKSLLCIEFLYQTRILGTERVMTWKSNKKERKEEGERKERGHTTPWSRNSFIEKRRLRDIW